MGPFGSEGKRAVVIGLATVALVSAGLLAMPTLAAPKPSNDEVTLTSGTTMRSEWLIVNDAGTSNGRASGGTCPNEGGVPGLAVEDASYDVGGTVMDDAFDNGLLFFVNNLQMVSPTSWDVQSDPANPALNRVLTSGPTALSGLNATVEYRALPHQQVLRSTVSLANSGTNSVTVPFTVATNFGSDDTTVVVGTSSGDSDVTGGDRWVVTADDPTSPNDPLNTSVLAGPGPIAAAPMGISETVFDCSHADGLQATFQVTVPPGGTRALMFFNELSSTIAAAVGAAARFNATPSATDELLVGMSEAQRASIVNWRLTAPPKADARIRRFNSKTYLGNNVFNSTGKKQTVRTALQRGESRRFKVKVNNDGNSRIPMSLHGRASAKGLRVRYFSGGRDVTAAITSGRGLMFSRAPGAAIAIDVRVKVMRGAAKGSRKFVTLTATGSANGFDRVDAVKAVMVVR